ncbi:MAG: energy transducer TonB [Flavobacteriales bacterium]
MKVIKTPNANLETKRFRFFQLGLIVACSLALLAFRWTTYELNEEHVSQVELKNFNELEPELPKLHVRQKQKVVKVQLDNRFVQPTKDELVKTTSEPALEKVSMFIDLVDVDCPECPDEGEPEPEPLLPEGPLDWSKMQRTPYFDSCASPSDRIAESECTYSEIKNFVQRNTIYPEIPREMGVQGTVWLTFVINKKGEVSEVEVVRSPHSELTEAAIKGLSKLPRMNPGLQRLNPVDVKLQIPVKFILQ